MTATKSGATQRIYEVGASGGPDMSISGKKRHFFTQVAPEFKRSAINVFS